MTKTEFKRLQAFMEGLRAFLFEELDQRPESCEVFDALDKFWTLFLEREVQRRRKR